jgi:hypothetical protein
MGTRSLTVIQDADNDEEIAVLYRQMDGYPEGHGRELAEFLSGMAIVDGLPPGRGERDRLANGAECLAAQIVAHFKQEPGGFYLYPAGTRSLGEEYIYYVKVYTPAWNNETKPVGIILDVSDGALGCSGPPEKFPAWLVETALQRS